MSSTPPNKGGGKRKIHPYMPYSTTITNSFSLWFDKWYVRIISLTLVTLVTAVYVVIYPVVLLLALIIDAVRFSKVKGLNITRSSLFFLAYLAIEYLGIFMCLGLYIWKIVTSPTRERWYTANYNLQTIWGKYMIFESIRRVLGIKLELEFTPSLTPGPKILFMRHVSFADTLIPQGTLSDKFQLKYILKRDLLWDPSINICGSRTPQFFLYREAGSENAMDVELKGMAELVSTLTPQSQSVICLWPEGTRFTPGKRKKILESLAKKDPKSYKVAEQLNNTLLPRAVGALNLLEANTCADVFFCSHVGLEGAATFYEMISGSLCNRTLRVKFECVKFKDIPKTKEERTQWLYDNWKKIDSWIEENQKQLAEAKKRK